MQIPIVFSALALAAALTAQPNLRPGTDVSNTLGSVGSPPAASGGRFGTYPNGQQAWGVATTSCNVGTINVPWLRDMNVDHPEMGMWMYRELDGRFEQVSLFRGVKHGFTSTNSPGCGSCPGGAGTSLVVGCTDTYDATLNYSHTYMAPPSEINPWTGLWTSRGSHFDRGFPVQSPPLDTDNVRSGINFPNSNPGYRNLVWDSELNAPGAIYWVSGYYVVIGEPDARRENNFDTRRFAASWGGTQWSWSTPVTTHYQQPAIYRWTGATVNSATNGADDGRMYVAVKVTGPNANGRYRYEYAVFNRDNNREGGAFRIPVCAGAQVGNLLFRDPDHTPGNDWVFSRTATHLVWTAPAGHVNNLTWGNLFNVGFDCDVSPAAGSVLVDQAKAGPGAAAVTVASNCPLDARNLFLGAGCGAPTAPVLTANGPALVGNSSFAVQVSDVAAASTNVFLFSANTANLLLAPCRVYVVPAAMLLTLSIGANASGVATLPIPVPNNAVLDGAWFALQAAELQSGGAYGGMVDFSCGLKVKIGILTAGCN
jgi:hypothetical protein